MKQILKIAVAILATVACSYSAQAQAQTQAQTQTSNTTIGRAQNQQNIRQDWLVFIGEVETPELVTEGTFSQDTIDHTLPFVVLTFKKDHFLTKAKIIKPLYGNCPEGEITFSIYDEFNPPVWPNDKVEMCVLYKNSQEPEMGYQSPGAWIDSRLFKTTDGEWVIDYQGYIETIAPLDGAKYFARDCKPVNIVVSDSITISRKKSPGLKGFPKPYNERYYSGADGLIYPTYAVSIEQYMKRLAKRLERLTKYDRNPKLLDRWVKRNMKPVKRNRKKLN